MKFDIYVKNIQFNDQIFKKFMTNKKIQNKFKQRIFKLIW